ncbi:MAG: IPExxxVDY family protein [Bacteroidetes bacterium]|nr:IPExxxVDY family protein [Bacteroidota bacterium]
MAKTILKLDDEDQFDFMLIGIVSQHKDYRLGHELNAKFDLHLTRENDHEVFNNKRMEKISFSVFHFVTDEEDHYHLISNKGKNGLLIPEQKQIDFFLVIRENVKKISETEMINRLKAIKGVLGVFKTNPGKLKSRENLLF